MSYTFFPITKISPTVEGQCLAGNHKIRHIFDIAGHHSEGYRGLQGIGTLINKTHPHHCTASVAAVCS